MPSLIEGIIHLDLQPESMGHTDHNAKTDEGICGQSPETESIGRDRGLTGDTSVRFDGAQGRKQAGGDPM